MLVVLVLVVTGVLLAVADARRDVRNSSRDQAVAVALSISEATLVRDAIGTADASELLRRFADGVRAETGVDFVVISDLDRSGFVQSAMPALDAEAAKSVAAVPHAGLYTEEYVGALGPSIRAVSPVRATETDQVIAVVAVGIALDKIKAQLLDELRDVAVAAVAVLTVGLAGAVLLNRRLRRQTHGLGEQEITRMYEYYRAVLHAVREGLLLIDYRGGVQLVNDEARRLLDLDDDVVGRTVEDLGLPPALAAAASGNEAGTDDVYVAGDRVLVVSSCPAYWEDRDVGTVVTLRDHTELRALTGELDVVRGLTESLRAQTHEAANRLHVVVSLIEMGRTDEAMEFATEELQLAQLLTDRMMGAVGEPIVTALLVGKTSDAAERGVQLRLTGQLPAGQVVASPRDLVTVIGNLVDNALDAVAGREDRRVAVHLGGDSKNELCIVVGDSGPGLTLEEAGHVLERGWTTKASLGGPGRGIGLALVAQVAKRHYGDVTVGTSTLGGAELTVALRGQS